jgi:DNA-directed RNA polymerase specialized sigma24 family protein
MTPNPFAVVRSPEVLLMIAPVETLVARVIAGDASAWKALWQVVEPRLLAMLRRPRFLGRLSRSEDDCRNIAVEVLGALRADDHARLRRYTEALVQNPTLPFFAWLAVVAKRMAIDYMRRQGTYVDRRGGGAAWVDTGTLPPDSQLPGERPPFTDGAAARHVRELAATELAPEQHAAVTAWTEGRGFAEIAAELGISERHAERVVRAGLERLRRRVRTGGAR